MNTEELIKLIINKAYEVRSHFVAGYLESVYKKALLIELREAGLKVEEEVEMPVIYKGHVIGDLSCRYCRGKMYHYRTKSCCSVITSTRNSTCKLSLCVRNRQWTAYKFWFD